MNRKVFFDHVRANVFGGSLNDAQFRGMEALLNSMVRNDVTDKHHRANILAQVHKETGGHMLGIKETVYPSHKNKNPSDATVIKRLDRAWAKGQLGRVRTPYWRDGAFGRGPIQLTHWANYRKFGARLGINLRANPSLALEPDIGADIAVIGMKEGMFRTHGLSDYVFPRDLDNEPDTNPRRIVNGKDGSDRDVAKMHRRFYRALEIADDGTPDVAKQNPEPLGKTEQPTNWFMRLLRWIFS